MKTDKIPKEPELTVEFNVRMPWRHGCKKLAIAGEPNAPPREPGRVPRIARLMALALYLHKLIDNGAVRDYAEISRITGITRARVTQIMNLTLLAPEIQEEILFLPRVESGHDPIAERNIRIITCESLWEKQKLLWEELSRRSKY